MPPFHTQSSTDARGKYIVYPDMSHLVSKEDIGAQQITGEVFAHGDAVEARDRAERELVSDTASRAKHIETGVCHGVQVGVHSWSGNVIQMCSFHQTRG